MRWMCTLFYYLTGCLVGVTSHTTPLPAGEGLGEGPLSVWVCETCSSVFFCEKKKARGALGVLSLTEFTE